MDNVIQIRDKYYSLEAITNVARVMGKSIDDVIQIISDAIAEYDRRMMEIQLEAERRKLEAMMEAEEQEYCFEDATSNIHIKRHTDPRNKKNSNPIKGFRRQNQWMRTRSNPKLR